MKTLSDCVDMTALSTHRTPVRADIWCWTETNIGGDMVVDVLRQHDETLFVKKVTATKSKRTRAEPVAALYEQGRVIHTGEFHKLEDELIELGSYDGYLKGRHKSPDRADALVWAVWELLVEPRGEGPRATQL